jgi:hypothetical protein
LYEWASLEVSPEWLEWLEVEEHATELLVYETRLVHGLLQTPAYAETILSPEKVGQRLARQQVFERGTPPFFEALLDECVLHRKVGSPEIMVDQLTHLVEMASSDLIIRIVPFDADLARLPIHSYWRRWRTGSRSHCSTAHSWAVSPKARTTSPNSAASGDRPGRPHCRSRIQST